MDPYLGEIRLFAGNYAPENWCLCDGRTLPIQGNEALYSLIGTAWGGNGSTNFALPNLQGRLPVGQGQGTGLQSYVLGQYGGQPEVQLVDSNMPAHSHSFSVSTKDASSAAPSDGSGLAKPVSSSTGRTVRYVPASPAPVALQMDALSVTTAPGGGLAHDNVMPYLCVNYIICTTGLYPQRP